MKYGFGDEAGDVGGGKGSSRHLVIAIVLTDDPQRLRRAVARIRKGLRKKLKQIPEPGFRISNFGFRIVNLGYEQG